MYKEKSYKQKKFYNSTAWRKVSKKMKVDVGYVCNRCKWFGDFKDMITHHVIYLTDTNVDDYEVSLNEDNLEVICIQCHNKEHSGVITDVLRYDIDGNVISSL